MTSVVIAAHNEGRNIGRCLDALLGGNSDGSLEVVVAANGCSDDTVAAASRPGVVVIDLPMAGKAAAINAAERRVVSFPRIYLDADCLLTSDDIARLVVAVEAKVADAAPPLAVTACRVVDTAGRPFVVRHYYRMLAWHPAFKHALFGRGVVVLSESGRARFENFPGVLADDFFLDSLFTAAEKREVPEVVSVVAAPSTSRILVRRLARVRRGNREVRARRDPAVRARRVEGWTWLVNAVRAAPTFAPSAAIYAAVTLCAIAFSRLARVSWGHDQGRPVELVSAAGDAG